MRRVLALWIACLTGCGFSASNAGAGDARPGGPDAVGLVTPDACASFSSQIDTCDLSASGDLSWSAATYDTGTGTLTVGTTESNPPSEMITGPAGPLRLVLAHSFTLTSGALRVQGPVPFGVLATATIEIDGVIDASDGGAGAGTTACGTSTGGGGTNGSGGGGGGGGGGLGAAGGGGGSGDKDGAKNPGGAAGAAAPVPLGPLGGCPGGVGGIGDDTASAGGNGGGAVYLTAGSALTIGIAGGVNTGGGGGSGGAQSGGNDGDDGGGGGGAAGTIMLESPAVFVHGTLAANGGGGGEGSGAGRTGKPGSPGALGDMQAAGGSGGSSTGVDGAAGGAGSKLAGETVTDIDKGGGGGGGGSVGFVFVIAPHPTIDGTVSPPVTAD